MPQSSDLSVTDSLNVILNMANNGGEFLCEIYNCQLIRKLRMAARYGSYMIEGNDKLTEDNFKHNYNDALCVFIPFDSKKCSKKGLKNLYVTGRGTWQTQDHQPSQTDRQTDGRMDRHVKLKRVFLCARLSVCLSVHLQ